MTEDEKNHREFISAAAAVYAWMSAADGEVTKSEVSGFVEYLCSLEYVNEISDSDFEELYLNLLAAFTSNFEDGLSRAQSRIETFKGDAQKSSDLLRVARKSLVADQKFNEAEELALKEIAALLGVDEEDVL